MPESDTLDLSATQTAPFHRPLRIEEFRLHCVKHVGSAGAKEVENALDIGEGWVLSIFSLTRRAGQHDECRSPAWGWVKGPFGIHDETVNGIYLAALSHPHSGVTLCFGQDAEELTAIAAMIEPRGDWTTFDQDDEVIAQRVLDTLFCAGYRSAQIYIGQGVSIPLFIAHRAAGRA